MQQHVILTFVINHLLRKLDAMKAGTVFMKDAGVNSVNLPSKEDILSYPDEVTAMTKFIFQYNSMVRDGKSYYKLEQHNEVGTKRDLEWLNEFSRPEKEHPIYAALFRTMAFPYASAYYFHRLFSYGNGDDINNINHRRAKVVSGSMITQWVGTLLAELDIRYLAPSRLPISQYVCRFETGFNGNPHQHSLLYSEEYGSMISELKSSLQDSFDIVYYFRDERLYVFTE